MDVIGHRAAHGDEARAGDNRWKPAVRQRELRHLAQRAPRLAPEDAGLGVEGQKTAELPRQEDGPRGVEAHVPVASAHAVGQERLRGFGKPVAGPHQGDGALADGRVAAPRGGPKSIP